MTGKDKGTWPGGGNPASARKGVRENEEGLAAKKKCSVRTGAQRDGNREDVGFGGPESR